MTARVNDPHVPSGGSGGGTSGGSRGQGGQGGGRLRRPYDGSARQERAARNREAVLDAAQQLLLGRGYAATTVSAVAAGAGVSPESVYKYFGSKAGLVRAIYERGLKGTGAVPAEIRSDDAQQHETDSRRLMETMGSLAAEVLSQGAPLWILMRDAASAGHTELTQHLEQIREEKYQRMTLIARRLLQSGHIRASLTEQQAADVMWFYTSPEMYEVLVLQRGWDASQLAGFVAGGLAAQLL